MQKIASLDASLLGRSDPRLFVREIEKRSSDLCKRMQVASAAAVAAARRGPAVTESENCCPGGGSRLASFFPPALWCLCPTVSLLTVPLLSLSLRFALLLDEHPLFASYGTSRKRRNGRSPMMFMNERSCDCAPSNWLPKVVHGFEG